MKNKDPLHDRLQAWEFRGSIPPHFQAEVWKRIAAREEDRVAAGAGGLWEWLFPSRNAWQFAGAAIAVVLAASVTLGGLAASAANDRSRAELAQRYVQSVDPYLHVSRAF